MNAPKPLSDAEVVKERQSFMARYMDWNMERAKVAEFIKNWVSAASRVPGFEVSAEMAGLLQKHGSAFDLSKQPELRILMTKLKEPAEKEPATEMAPPPRKRTRAAPQEPELRPPMSKQLGPEGDESKSDFPRKRVRVARPNDSVER